MKRSAIGWTAAAALLALSGEARAGTGPWTLYPGSNSLYVALESSRSTRFATGELGDDKAFAGEGPASVGLQGVLSFGQQRNAEVEIAVPWRQVRVPRVDACSSLPEDYCATTRGLGVISVRGKAMLLDELRGPPISLAIGPELRVGELPEAARARLTNLGEATTDLGAFAAVGHVGLIGSWGWSGATEFGGRLRSPQTRIDGRAEPGAEVFGNAELLLTPHERVSIGPTASGLLRPSGADWPDVTIGDPEAFGSLRVGSALAGGKLLVRSGGHVTFVTSVLRTVAARNNPSDTLTVSVGVSLLNPLRPDPVPLED